MDMSIQAELSDVMSKVNAWSLARETDLLAVSAKHKSFLDTHHGWTDELKKKEKEASADFKTLTIELNKHQEVLQDMKQDNVALEKENASLPVELASLEFKVKEELELVKLQQAALDASNLNNTDTTHCLEGGHEMYQNRLGLKIDPANPGKQFRFSIRLNEDESYNVKDCEPMVENLEELVEELNASNSLSLFVRSVRKEWRAQVADAE
ncbi:chromosome segregation protein Spc25-domain-containing protein [Baffinella frigidus]|nr:chromosome segregation protein Spc25-domain-containing protein [Cryptophyta sp. CCMP2293]